MFIWLKEKSVNIIGLPSTFLKMKRQQRNSLIRSCHLYTEKTPQLSQKETRIWRKQDNLAAIMSHVAFWKCRRTMIVQNRIVEIYSKLCLLHEDPRIVSHRPRGIWPNSDFGRHHDVKVYKFKSYKEGCLTFLSFLWFQIKDERECVLRLACTAYLIRELSKSYSLLCLCLPLFCRSQSKAFANLCLRGVTDK